MTVADSEPLRTCLTSPMFHVTGSSALVIERTLDGFDVVTVQPFGMFAATTRNWPVPAMPLSSLKV